MGGGPVDEDDESVGHGEPLGFASPPPQELVDSTTPSSPPPTSSFPATAPPPLLSAETPSRVNEADLERPVLTTMAAGGIVGGVLGSMLGMGGMLGTTTGAIIGASVASRDDAMGAKARHTALFMKHKAEEGITKALYRLNQEPVGRDLTGTMSNALQTIVEVGEKYKVVDQVESAANKAYRTAEPKVQHLYEKLREADRHEYIPRVQSAVFALDQATGFSRSVEAVKRELKL